MHDPTRPRERSVFPCIGDQFVQNEADRHNLGPLQLNRRSGIDAVLLGPCGRESLFDQRAQIASSATGEGEVLGSDHSFEPAQKSFPIFLTRAAFGSGLSGDSAHVST
jgi:hypothetical protein